VFRFAALLLFAPASTTGVRDALDPRHS